MRSRGVPDAATQGRGRAEETHTYVYAGEAVGITAEFLKVEMLSSHVTGPADAMQCDVMKNACSWRLSSLGWPQLTVPCPVPCK
jgi:hypothetical protein